MSARPRVFCWLTWGGCGRRILPGDRYWAVAVPVALVRLDASVVRRTHIAELCHRCGKP